LRKSALRKLVCCFGSQPALAFPGKIAESYYLPEGRYYAAPLVLKRCGRKSRAMPWLLGLGFSFVSISGLSQKPPAAVPANATVLSAVSAVNAPRNVESYEAVADSGLRGAFNGDHFRSLKTRRRFSRKSEGEIQTASLGSLQGIAASPAGAREDSINRSGKGNSVLSLRYNGNSRLVNYDAHYMALAQAAAERSFLASLKNHPQQAYIVRFMPPRESKAKQIAMGFVPIPKKPAPPSLPVPQMLTSLVTNNKPDILALGYASTPDPAAESPFDSILTEKPKDDGRFIPPIGKSDHPWAATPLPASAFQPQQQKCLAEAVYFEARSESLKGQAAVAQVVLNRVRNPAYPDTICKVVYQNVNWYNHCQFSFACDGRKHYVTELKPWHTAQAIAKAVTAGQIWLADIGSSTHYHAVYVHPQWAGFMDRMDKIGRHIFYRTRGGGWS